MIADCQFSILGYPLLMNALRLSLNKRLFKLACVGFVFLAGAAIPAKADGPQDRIKVAFIGSFASGDPNTSRELERGMLAFLQTNPEAKRRIEVVKFDNHGSVLETVKVFDKIKEQHISFILGIARSDEAMAAAKEAGSQGKLFITPFATNPLIARQGPYVFQVCFTDAFQGKVLADFSFRELKAKKILVLVNSESIYSNGLSSAFLKALRPEQQSHVLEYTEGDMKVDQVLAELQGFKADVVLIPDHITRASLLAKAIRKFDPRVLFLGGDGFGGKKILMSVFGDAPDIELFYTTHWNASVKNETNKAFLKSYVTSNPGEEPTTGAAMSFDATKVLWESLKDAHLKDDPALVAASMRGREFELTTGKLIMPRSSTEEPRKSAVVVHLKNGEYSVFKTVDP